MGTLHAGKLRLPRSSPAGLAACLGYETQPPRNPSPRFGHALRVHNTFGQGVAGIAAPAAREGCLPRRQSENGMARVSMDGSE
jgi:hypothetical protein